MAAPVLLVHDDIAAIASVRRLLTRVGHDVILATSSADALIAFGHHLPALVILSPGIEGGRGKVVVEELGQHPEHRRLRLLLLGGEVPGFDAPVVSLPLDGRLLLDAVEEAIHVDSPGLESHERDALEAAHERRQRQEIEEELERWARARQVPPRTTDEYGWLEERASRELPVSSGIDQLRTGSVTSGDSSPVDVRLVASADESTVGRSPAPAFHLPQSGAASLEELARLTVQVADLRGPIRLELRADEAVRTLWFESGWLIAAESTLPHESLSDRARRDGLIDARQHRELRQMRAMSTVPLLQLLMDRGYIREQEAVPLVQRHAEQIALEGLSEARSQYVLIAETPGDGVVVGQSTRSLIGMVVDALRKSLDGAERIAMLGGLAAIPSIAHGAEHYVYGLQLGEREQRFLEAIDGETTVESILLAVGLRQGSALKLLAALVALGWLELTPPDAEASPPPPPTLDLERLDVKFQEVQEADYFAILGLSRAARGEEIQRAYAQLSAEFDPLKYAGHPDGNVHHRARQVKEALSEAAHVLSDDRLRASYSRHLVG